MKKIVIFGAGNLGTVLAAELSHDNEVLGFLDNNNEKWGKEIEGFPVLGNAEVLKTIEYDEIVIASTMRFDEIKAGLLENGITEDKFNSEIHQRLLVEVQSRVNFLRDFARMYHNVDKEYAVAEGGVFQGMFAAEINKKFPDRKLYLFDTFTGFDKRDVNIEKNNGYSDVVENYYSETSEELVLKKMIKPDNVIIRKGFFPETAVGLEDKQFMFVNLDFDLYAPILAGLEFFYPRMMHGGVVLIHDYFTEFYHGVREAVEKFEQKQNMKLVKMPIGDGISLAIICNK